MSVSAEDREKAIALIRDDPSPSGNVDALIAAGWRAPGEFDGDTSAEALAAWARYRELPVNHVGFEHVEQDAFTAGFDAARSGSVAARPTREALMMVMAAAWGRAMVGADGTDGAPLILADALLAADHLWTPSSTEDAADVIKTVIAHSMIAAGVELTATDVDQLRRWIEAHSADGVDSTLTSPVSSAPVVDREALAKALHDAESGARPIPWDEPMAVGMRKTYLDRADVLIASSLFVDRAVVEAEQREKDAQIVLDINASYRDRDQLGAQRGFAVEVAAAIRAGGAS